MAQFRQSGADRSATRSDPLPSRIPHKPGRIRVHRRSSRRLPATAFAALILLAALLALLFLASRLLSSGPETQLDSEDNEPGTGFRLNRAAFPKILRFGKGSGASGGDSRYWDRDDRRRDRDFVEDDVFDVKDEVRLKEKKEKEPQVKNGGGLYNEGGRAELDSYKKEYEKSLKDVGQTGTDNASEEDDYDDGIDAEDDSEAGEGDGEAGIAGGEHNMGKNGKKSEKGSVSMGLRKVDVGTRKERSLVGGGAEGKIESSEKKSAGSSKKKARRSSCEMKFLNSTRLIEPVENKKFARFSLQYTYVEDRPSGLEDWEPRFAGHQGLQEREKSFYAQDQTINCGFVKGPIGSPSTGFDIAEDDVRYMSSCHIGVASCIFGNSDRLRTPYGKTITRQSKKNVCFIMFMDEDTLQTLLSEGQQMDNTGSIGLWKIVVVKNLPYTDMRRVGKIPKFLAHRLFTSARYSIWLDSKLRLQRDPLLILEYFLWRRGYEYAISNHYDRHCVWEEVMQNKKLNKFNHSIIDQQFHFYQQDGLKRFDPSDPNKLLPSYVPEGSFIVRAHTPMSNLFSCLWFNEVDRFTPRDQLSFAYTYLKLRRMNPNKPFHLHMFKDCERRAIAKLFHHRAEEKKTVRPQTLR
ncbi:uncharacterized protein LOC120275896 [Dioscorea cayenensis subsp. rotundata]|uniref:Uncharacterized protein LOC120275896 n=1 Tax=Dioscorea cayennensis subsp. rotundata TaxID=55577 RepID=A0AB40CK09_DIOCR|nr:uncharacterized protein LOC120275896 [Dioscorea cayenensis subsp. rotundata]